MTDEQQKRLILLTALLDLGGEATKEATLDHIRRRGYIVLTDWDLATMGSRDELVWRNNLAFVRKHLVDNGCIDGTTRNRWKITPIGKSHLRKLLQQNPGSGGFGKMTAPVVARARELVAL